MEEVKSDSWNKKRIFVAILILLLLIAGGLFFRIRVLDQNSSPAVKSAVDNKVEQSSPEIKTNIQEIMREKIDTIKQEVSSLDMLEIASSSPQVKKILNDIKSLEQYPSDQIKEACRKICGL